MKIKFNQLIIGIIITLIILFIFEVVLSTFLPILGLGRYILPINVLIILYLSFELDTPLLSVLIFLVQYTHSIFSVEEWAIGTIAGVIIGFIVSFLRDLLRLSTPLITIVIVQIFQIIWFIITSFLNYMQTNDFNLILSKLWLFIPESLIISILSPLFFFVLNKIWRVNSSSMVGQEN
ncbi:MAG: hypothetical protein HOJ35_01300 [Bdellovibrionales bacterium]|jgi:hypothetical protein|nr:hypothetical protein [Bdellovibrionales bacterium]